MNNNKLCAKDFIEWLTERNKTSQIQWNIRVGLASGSSIAGIIGKKKYLYDIVDIKKRRSTPLEQ